MNSRNHTLDLKHFTNMNLTALQASNFFLFFSASLLIACNPFMSPYVPNVHQHQQYDARVPCATIPENFPGPTIAIFGET